jgi:Holliday junction resolvasome RuvABC ATP-dependent DNA helicase subunit
MTRMLPLLAMKNEVIRLKEYWQSYISVLEDSSTQLRQQVMDERATKPCFEEASVVGRGSDKQRIMAVLLSAASNIRQGSLGCIILPIFGFAGTGKTTLAQMVFNDDTYSLQQYDFRVWVYVSPELDFHEISESITSGDRLFSPGP